MQHTQVDKHFTASLQRKSSHGGKNAIPRKHPEWAQPVCGHINTQNVHVRVSVCVCVWEANERSSLSLGSYRAVMDKASVDIV